MEDCSSSIAAFCMQLRSYCLRLEASCATLRASVNRPPSSLPSPNFPSLLTTLIDRVSSVSEVVGNLECKTTETISFEELLGHSMEIYKQNEASINALEERLKEYGYTPMAELLVNDVSENPTKTFDLSGLTLEEAAPRQSVLSNVEGVNAPADEATSSLAAFGQAKEQFGLFTVKEVIKAGQFGAFYPETLSLQDLGLSAAGLACLAQEDSSPGVDYNTSSKGFGSDLAVEENAYPIASKAVEEDEHTEPDLPVHDVPFFQPVDEYEYSSCPTWLKVQISYEDVSEITARMHDILLKKEAGSNQQLAQSTLNQEDIAALNAGTKTKPCLLLLVKLGRLHTGHENGATVYHVIHR